MATKKSAPAKKLVATAKKPAPLKAKIKDVAVEGKKAPAAKAKPAPAKKPAARKAPASKSLITKIGNALEPIAEIPGAIAKLPGKIKRKLKS